MTWFLACREDTFRRIVMDITASLSYSPYDDFTMLLSAFENVKSIYKYDNFLFSVNFRMFGNACTPNAKNFL